MAYADAIDGPNWTATSAAALINGLQIGYGSVELNSVLSTASTTYVDVTGSTVSVTLASGQRALALGQMVVGNSTSGKLVTMSISIDGTDQAFIEPTAYCTRAGTAGFEHTLNWMAVTAPGAGAHSYKLRWKTDGGTAYSQYQRLYVIKFQYA